MTVVVVVTNRIINSSWLILVGRFGVVEVLGKLTHDTLKRSIRIHYLRSCAQGLGIHIHRVGEQPSKHNSIIKAYNAVDNQVSVFCRMCR